MALATLAPLTRAEAAVMLADLADLLDEAWRLDGRIRERLDYSLTDEITPAMNSAEIDPRCISTLVAAMKRPREPDN